MTLKVEVNCGKGGKDIWDCWDAGETNDVVWRSHSNLNNTDDGRRLEIDDGMLEDGCL